MYSQFDLFENIIWCAISLFSLVAIMAAFNTRILIVETISVELRLKLVAVISYVVLATKVISLIHGISIIGTNKVEEALAGEFTGRGFLSLLFSIGDLIFLLYAGYLFSHKKTKFFLFYSIYFFSILLTSAHRTPVAIAFITPIFIYIFKRYNSQIKVKFIIAIFLVLVNLMYFMNFFRQGIANEMSLKDIGSTVAVLNTMRGLNTSKNLHTLIEKNYKKEYLSKIHYLILGFVPRRLYKSKPTISFNIRTTEAIYGYNIGEDKDAIIRTFTLPGEGYIQLGMIGVFIFTFIAVYMTRGLFNFMQRINYSDFLIVNYVFTIFLNFRSAFDSFYFDVIYKFVFLLAAVLLVGRISFRNQKHTMLLIKD